MTFLEKICQALNQNKVGYVIVGGYAVALHGAVRGTLDVDIALRWTLRDLKKAEQVLNDLGLVSRLPISADDIFQFRDEYIKNRNLVAWNFYNPLNLAEQLDIIITYDAKGRRRESKKLASATVPVLNKQDLIEMKRRSGRPQDNADIDALEKIK